MRNKNFGGGCFYGRQDISNYEFYKERAREKAKDWQSTFGNGNFSFFDLYVIANYFNSLAKQYGLVKEFKENGII